MRLLRRFFKPKILTLEKTANQCFSQMLLLSLGLLILRVGKPRSLFSLASRLCRIRELAIAAAMVISGRGTVSNSGERRAESDCGLRINLQASDHHVLANEAGISV